ncbi:MAG: OmpA family protein [Bacteroidales bacterium]|nr:OmpA family protein [Bacteroidales bacterium]
MKKLALAVLAFFALATYGYAQDVASEDFDRPETEAPQYGRRILINKFSENWEISARIGTQAYLGEYVFPRKIFQFKDWWTFPAFDFGIQKWGTNSIGLAIGFTMSPFKSLYSVGKDGIGERKTATFSRLDDPLYTTTKDGGSYYLASGRMGNVYMSAIFNLSNLFGGYKASRFYVAVFSVGGGIMFPMSPTNYREICSSFNAGIVNKFRLADHLTLDIAIRGTLHDDMFNGVSYYTSMDYRNLSVDATIGGTIGLSYRFNWTKSSKKDAKGRPVNEEGWTTVDEIVTELPDYQNLKAEAVAATAAVAASTAALAAAEDRIIKQEKVIQDQETIIKENVKRETFTYRQLINFVIDTWKISNREKVAIMLAAEVIKEHPDAKFLVAGYADKQTATPAHNKMLSNNRANAVYNCLVNEFGVNPEQLDKVDYGGVDYMFFEDKQCSRSVLITTTDLLKGHEAAE